MSEQNNSEQQHGWVEDRLSSYIDNQLDALERARLERHLQTCDDCRQSLDSLRWTVSLVRLSPRPALPRQFTLPRQFDLRAPAPRPLFGLATLRLATAIATLILVSLLGIDLIQQNGGASAPALRSAARPASLPPTVSAPAAASPTTETRSESQVFGVAPPAVAPTSVPTPMLRSVPTSAPASTAAPAAATAASPPTAMAQKSLSQATAAPTSATPATTGPTLPQMGLGAGPVPTSEPNAADSAQTLIIPSPTISAVPTRESQKPADMTGQVTLPPTIAPNEQALNLPTLPPTSYGESTRETLDFTTPLRIAELVALFATVFLGTALILMRFRR